MTMLNTLSSPPLVLVGVTHLDWLYLGVVRPAVGYALVRVVLLRAEKVGMAMAG